MSLIEVGIDPEAARQVALRWSDTGARCRAELDEARARAAAVMVGDSGWLDGRAVDGLQLASALLLDRAAAMAAISWSSPFGSLGVASGWGWRHRSPFDDDDDWIDASRAQSYLALVSWLVGGRRGYLVQELADPTNAEWAAMVAAGTIWEGARNVRYFDIEPDPGAGVLVVDFFIPDGGLLLLEGDDRAHVDPIFGDVDADDSRALMIFDLESGRAAVHFDETCTTVGPCRAARPITLDGEPSAIGDDGLLTRANRLTVDSSDGLEVDFDLLNSITTIGSVNGTLALRNRGDGRYRVEEFDADEYPSVGVYQYREAQSVVTLHRRDSEGPSHLLPWWPELPDVPDWPDLPDPPDIPVSAPDWLPNIEWEGPDLPAGPDLPDLPKVWGVDLPNLPKFPDLPKLPSIDLSPDIEGRAAPDLTVDDDEHDE